MYVCMLNSDILNIPHVLIIKLASIKSKGTYTTTHLIYNYVPTHVFQRLEAREYPS